MKYFIDNNSKQKAYMQLYEQLRADITNLVYKDGDKLPSKRLLADETFTSVITVEHAYSILCEEGYIEAKERSGYYVTYRKGDFVPIAEYEQHNIPVTHNNYHANDEFPFSVFAKTMRNVISKYGEQILIKSPNSGCYELRKAISDYLARCKGISVTADQIVIGSGAEYLYNLVVLLFDTSRTFAIEDPSYEKIRQVYIANGVKVDALSLGVDGIKTEELERTKASVLHVTPFNSFPSGITADISKRKEYLRWAERKKGYIIEDNYDSELTVSRKNEDTMFSLSKDGRVIYMNTFSETIAPSMRIGYMVIPETLTEVFKNKLGFLSCTVPVLEQYILAELINSGDFERHINRVRRERRKVK